MSKKNKESTFPVPGDLIHVMRNGQQVVAIVTGINEVGVKTARQVTGEEFAIKDGEFAEYVE